jgi:ribosome modulation factor
MNENKTTTKKRFDRLLHAMATRPEPSEKPATDNRTSGKGPGWHLTVMRKILALLGIYSPPKSGFLLKLEVARKMGIRAGARGQSIATNPYTAAKMQEAWKNGHQQGQDLLVAFNKQRAGAG